MQAPADPRYRAVMKQARRLNASLKFPGKICVLRHGMPGAPDLNATWERHRDWALANWGWRRVQPEPSTFIVEQPTGMPGVKQIMMISC
jgi:aminoglycoside phosphotransferase (APT) family kinase protein